MAVSIECVGEPPIDAELAFQPVGGHHADLDAVALGAKILDELRTARTASVAYTCNPNPTIYGAVCGSA